MAANSENILNKRVTKKLLSIGDAAKLLGVSVDTLRNWEDAGTIIPLRSKGGIRRYTLTQLRTFEKRHPKLAKNSRLPAPSARTKTVAETIIEEPVVEASPKTSHQGDASTDSQGDALTYVKASPYERKLPSSALDRQIASSAYVQSKAPVQSEPEVITIGAYQVSQTVPNYIKRIAVVGVFASIATILLTSGIMASYLSRPTPTKQFFAVKSQPSLKLAEQSSEIGKQEVLGAQTSNTSPSFLAVVLTPFSNLAQTTIQTIMPATAKELGIYQKNTNDRFDDLDRANLVAEASHQRTEAKLDNITNLLEDNLATLSAQTIANAQGQEQISQRLITKDAFIGKVIIDTGGNIYPTVTYGQGTLGTSDRRFSGIYANSASILGPTILGASSTDYIKMIGRLANDIIPSGNGTESLGDGDHYFKNGYINNITADKGGATTWSVAGNLTTSVTTFNLVNDTATTINFGGAATAVNIGASSGTTTINNNLDIAGSTRFRNFVSLPDGTAASPALRFTNDTDSGLYRLDSNTIALITGGTAGNGVTINTSGNVGIGTTSPATALDITGSGTFSENLAVSGGTLSTTAATASLFNANATALNIGGAATSISLGAATGTATINNAITQVAGVLNVNGSGASYFTGNVGVGTTSPSSALHVIGSIQISTGLIKRSDNQTVIDISADPIIYNPNGTPVLTVGSGAAGDGTSRWGGLAARHNLAGEEPYGLVFSDNGAMTLGGGRNTMNAVTNINFNTATNNTTQTGNTRMTITGAGNVGINDSSPAALFVVGNGDLFQVNSSGYTLLPDGTASTPALSFTGDTDTGLYRLTGNTLRLTTGGSATNGITIESNGNIGIATTAPIYKLDVNGNARLGATQVTGAITASTGNINIGDAGTKFGTVYADTVNATSLIGVVVGGSTNSNDWTINADNATDDAEAMNLIFERGTATPNALMSWDITNKQFTLNSGLSITNGIGSGNVGIGTTSPGAKLDIALGTITSDIPVMNATVTWNDAGTKNGIKLNVTDTSSGAASNLIDLQVGSATQFAVRKDGYATLANALRAGNGSASVPTFTFSSDTDTGIFTSEANTLNLATGGTEQMRIASNGNIGIGTTSPAYQLQVYGNTADVVRSKVQNDNASGFASTSVQYSTSAYLNQNVYGASYAGTSLGINKAGNAFITSGAATLAVGTADSNSLILATNDASRLAIDATGNVGIGTTSPGSLLSVGTNNLFQVNSSGNVFINGNQKYSTGGLSELMELNNQPTTYGGIAMNNWWNNTGSAVLVFNKSASDTEGVHALPAANSHIMMLIGRGSDGVSSFLSAARIDFDIDGVTSATSMPGAIVFRTTAPGDTNVTERMRINSAGNIGIGNTNPKVLLSVGTDVGINTTSFGTSVPAQGSVGVGLLIGKLDSFKLIQSYDSQPLAINYGGNNTLLNATGGNVGIGTTSPLAKLEMDAANADSIYFRLVRSDVSRALKMSPSINNTNDGLSAGHQEIETTGDLRLVTGNGGGGGDGDISFAPANVSRMFIQSSNGNVGIGTTAPSALLHVVGGSIRNDTSYILTNRGSIGAGTASNDLRVVGVGNLELGGNSAVGMTLTSAGNVGIGTTSPTDTLHVVNANRNAGILLKGSDPRITINSASTSDSSQIVFIDNTTQRGDIFTNGYGLNLTYTASSNQGAISIGSANNVMVGGAGSGDATAKLQVKGAGTTTGFTFRTQDNNSVDKFVIMDNGNVGIGTTNPGYNLDVNGNINANGYLQLTGSTSSYNTSVAPLIYNSAGNGSSYPFAESGNLIIQPRVTTYNRDIVLATGLTTPSPRMVIDRYGNVGIGTTGPNSNLQVLGTSGVSALRVNRGDVFVANNSDVDQGRFRAWSNGFNIDNPSSNPIYFGRDFANDVYFQGGGGGTVTNMIIKSGGNVGIGTTAPTSLLHLKGAATTSGTTLTIDNDYGESPKTINFSSSGTAMAQFKAYGRPTGAVPDEPYISLSLTDGSSLQDRIRIIKSGNVGIGTTAPLAKLELATGGADANSLVIANGNYYGAKDSGGTIRALLGKDTSDITTLITASGKDMQFKEGTSASMYIKTGGSVGIGTTNPTYTLDVRGNDIINVGTSGGSGLLRLAEIGSLELNGSNLNIGYSSGISNLIFNTNNGGVAAERMRVDTNGNVGIGTTNPSYKLDVVGTSNFYDSAGKSLIATTQTTEPSTISVAPLISVFSGQGNPGLQVIATDGSAFASDLIRGEAYRTASSAFNLLKLTVDADGTPDTKFLVQGNGNVGIGTTSPGAVLDILGNNSSGYALRISGPGSGNMSGLYIATGAGTNTGANIVLSSANTGNLISATGSSGNGYFKVTTAYNADPQMYISGNVGIGTTSPGQFLDITNTATGNVSGIRIANSDQSNTTTQTAGIQFSPDTRQLNGAWIRVGKEAADWGTGSNIDTFMSFNVDQDNSQHERLRITSSGNVGIGTTSPQVALDVKGTINASTQLNVNGGGVLNFPGGGPIGIGDIGNNNTALALKANSAEVMRLTNGNVGIGTTSPTTKLQVVGGALLLDNNQPIQWKGSDAIARNVLTFDSSNYLDLDNGVYGSGTKIQFRGNNGSSQSTVFSVSTDYNAGTQGNATLLGTLTVQGSGSSSFAGNVGIGTTSPGEKLEVNGNIRVDNLNYIKFPTSSWGTPFIGVYSNRADWLSFVSGETSSAGFRWVDGTAGNLDNAIMSLSNSGNLTVGGTLAVSGSGNSYFTGNVGIGTTSPLVKFNVNGLAMFGGTTRSSVDSNDAIYVQGPTSQYSQMHLYSTTGTINGYLSLNGGTDGLGPGAMNLWTYSNHPVNIGTNDSIKMTIAAGGNVGIGTTSPGYKLDLSFTGDNWIRLHDSNNATKYAQFGIEGGVTKILGNGNDVAIRTDGGGWSDKVTFKNSGNVGIGTTNPGSVLTIQSPTNGTEAYLSVLPLNSTQSVNIGYNHIYESGTNATNNLMLDSKGAGYLLLQTSGGTGGVGIGVGTPGTALDVAGTARATSLYAYNNTGTDIIRIQPGNDTNPTYNAITLGNAAWNSYPFTVQKNGVVNSAGLNVSGNAYASGNVYIGTTMPNAVAPLVVHDSQGETRVNGAGIGTERSLWYIANGNASGQIIMQINGTNRFIVDSAGNGSIQGCLTYNGGTLGACLSDIRLKKNINPVNLGLKEILGLNPVTFQYNGLGGTLDDGNIKSGLIAQQVEQVAPQLVSTREVQLYPTDTTLTQVKEVNYGALTFGLINSVKEQQDEINSYVAQVSSFNLSVNTNGSLQTPSLKVDQIAVTSEATISGELKVADNSLDSSGLTASGQPVASTSAIQYQAGTNYIEVASTLKTIDTQLAAVQAQADVLSAQIASSSAQIASTSAQLASNSAQLASTSAQLAKVQSDVDNLKLTSPDVLLATGSAVLANLSVASEATISGQLTAYQATISDTFKSLGTTSLASTTIAGDFTVDGTMSLTGNSVNSIGALFIQNSPLATLVDFFNGKAQIDNTGKISVQKVEVSSQTLSTATIPAGQTTLIVNTDQVTATSRIFLTPHQPVTLGVSSKSVGQSFTVQLNQAQAQDITFDWWIVDSKP